MKLAVLFEKLINKIESHLINSKRDKLSVFFESFLFKIIFYGIIILEPVAYLPQAWLIFSASPESINEAISALTLFFNVFISIGIMIGSYFYEDPRLFITSVVLLFVYSITSFVFAIRVWFFLV